MKKYILIIAVFFTIGIAGCKKDYLSLEVNPNSPSVTTPQLSLAGAEKVAADIVNGLNGDYTEYAIWGGYWTPSGNYVPSATLQQFQFTNSSFQQVWTDLYSNLTNFNNLQVLASKDASLANYQAIAMIMKAYDFEQLVDNFNDVPYSQAFQPSTILFPAYDKGVDIYHDLGKQLDAAIALINKGTAANPGSADIIFGGNMTGWKKFANSLKLRLAIRVSTLTPGDALVTDLASTAAEGYLDETIQAAANPGYSNVAGKISPFYANYGYDATGNPVFGNVFYRANDFFVKLLTNTNDPRLAQVYAPTTGGNIIFGNIFGDTKNSLANPGTSSPGFGLLQSPTQDAVLFSGAESLFLQAEAALQGYITGNPQTLYEKGITASFVALQAGSTTTYNATTGKYDYTAAAPTQSAALAVTYYSQAIDNVGYAASTNKLHAIILQKYISLCGYGNLEAYNEYRRTAFPVLPISIDPASISTTLPSRIPYPLSELTTNAANLAKEGTINFFTSKIFWATR
jgi:hypothetical protein